MDSPRNLRDTLIDVVESLSFGSATAEWLIVEFGIDPNKAEQIAESLAKFEHQERTRRKELAIAAVDQALKVFEDSNEILESFCRRKVNLPNYSEISILFDSDNFS